VDSLRVNTLLTGIRHRPNRKIRSLRIDFCKFVKHFVAKFR